MSEKEQTNEVKHTDLQHAVKDINEVFGMKQNKIAARQVLIDFILTTINDCIGPDPENPGEVIWTNERAGNLQPKTIATYTELAKDSNAQAAGEEDASKTCADFGKNYKEDEVVCQECLRAEECQTTMANAAAAAAKKKESAKKAAVAKKAAEPRPEKFSRSLAFLEAIKEGGTKQGLAEKSDQIYADRTSKTSNPAEAKFWTSNFLRLLTDMNLVEENAGIFKLK